MNVPYIKTINIKQTQQRPKVKIKWTDAQLFKLLGDKSKLEQGS